MSEAVGATFDNFRAGGDTPRTDLIACQKFHVAPAFRTYAQEMTNGSFTHLGTRLRLCRSRQPGRDFRTEIENSGLIAGRWSRSKERSGSMEC